MPLQTPKALPRIIGVVHDPEMLERTKRLINRLPKGSRVGLEMDYGHPDIKMQMQKYLRRTMDNNLNFFSALAKHATERGHKVVWLERPNSLVLPNERKIFDQYDQFCRIKLNRKQDESTLKELQEIENSFKQHDANQYDKAHWRSKIMARIIQRKADWKPTDVAIVGAAHAADISEIINHTVNKYIVNTDDLKEYKKDLQHRIGMLQVRYGMLNAKRINKKKGFWATKGKTWPAKRQPPKP